MQVVDRRGRELGPKAKVRRVLPGGTAAAIEGVFQGLDGAHRNACVEWHLSGGRVSFRSYPATRLTPFTRAFAVNDLELIDPEEEK